MEEEEGEGDVAMECGEDGLEAWEEGDGMCAAMGYLAAAAGCKVLLPSPALIVGPNRLFQAFDLHRRSPESGDVWCRPRRLEKPIRSRSEGLGCVRPWGTSRQRRDARYRPYLTECIHHSVLASRLPHSIVNVSCTTSY